jgi:hypothetical protein
LDLSAYRYNIGGGGTAVTTPARAAEDFLKADGSYDRSRDKGGRTFLAYAAKYGVKDLIGFVNSAPARWTTNGQSCGGQLKAGNETDFAKYVADVAARVDGLGYWGAYWRVVVPNSLNFFAAMATITFINGWNSFLWPLAIGQDPSAWTVQVALSSYMTDQTVNYHLIFMATAVSILPLLLVFLFLQRRLVQGIAQTGIKG